MDGLYLSSDYYRYHRTVLGAYLSNRCAESVEFRFDFVEKLRAVENERLGVISVFYTCLSKPHQYFCIVYCRVFGNI